MAAEQPGQGLSQSGPNITCWTISCRLSPNSSASVTGPGATLFVGPGSLVGGDVTATDVANPTIGIPGTGTATVKFFLSIIVAGFLLSSAPAIVEAVKTFSRRLAAKRGEAFAKLAAATIRTVARGVIGISALQALLAGIALVVAGVPGASLLTSAVLVLGIIQIGPAIVLIPVVIWAWFALDTTEALLFTAYMVPVNLLDNVLKPIVMGRGLRTPMLVILLGVVGGTLAQGITGLFLGPIVLAVIWELLVAWTKQQPTGNGGGG